MALYSYRLDEPLDLFVLPRSLATQLVGVREDLLDRLLLRVDLRRLLLEPHHHPLLLVPSLVQLATLSAAARNRTSDEVERKPGMSSSWRRVRKRGEAQATTARVSLTIRKFHTWREFVPASPSSGSGSRLFEQQSVREVTT